MQDKDKEIVQMEDAIPADVNAILQELPEEKRNAILTTMMAFEEERSFSGPLPPPEYLDAYEKTLPGAPDRILVMAEKQVDHRIDVEKTIVKKKFNQSTLGQIIGAILIFSSVTSHTTWLCTDTTLQRLPSVSLLLLALRLYSSSTKFHLFIQKKK